MSTSPIKISVLIALMYLCTFAVDSYLISRLEIPASLSKFVITTVLLLATIAILRSANTPVTARDFALPSANGFQSILILIPCFVVVDFGAAGWMARASYSDMDTDCPLPIQDSYEFVRMCIVSPFLETLLFVKLLPAVYVRRYPRVTPWVVFSAVAAFFAILHLQFSPLALFSKFLSGLVFCYVYFGTRSLPASFFLHGSLNFLVFMASWKCAAISQFVFRLPYLLSCVLLCCGLLAIYCVIKFLLFKSSAVLSDDARSLA